MAEKRFHSLISILDKDAVYANLERILNDSVIDISGHDSEKNKELKIKDLNTKINEIVNELGSSLITNEFINVNDIQENLTKICWKLNEIENENLSDYFCGNELRVCEMKIYRLRKKYYAKQKKLDEIKKIG